MTHRQTGMCVVHDQNIEEQINCITDLDKHVHTLNTSMHYCNLNLSQTWIVLPVRVNSLLQHRQTDRNGLAFQLEFSSALHTDRETETETKTETETDTDFTTL